MDGQVQLGKYGLKTLTNVLIDPTIVAAIMER